MHFSSPLPSATVAAGALLLCTTCLLVSSVHAQKGNSIDDSDDEGGAFSLPKTKKSGKLPRWSFDIGPIKMESFFQEHKLEDRLRLSKSYIKHNWYSTLNPQGSEDPLWSMKLSRVEELINCENLTTLLEPSEKATTIDCRPLEAHTLDETYVSPVSDLSITQYVRRSSFRIKNSSMMRKRSTRNDMLIYPLKRQSVLSYLGAYVSDNKLGDLSSLSRNFNLGYHVHVDIGASDSPLPVECNGEFYLSINRSESGYTRIQNDPYPEYADDISFLVDQARENGYLLSMHDWKCQPTNQLFQVIAFRLNFTLVQRQEFPYLFVRHTMFTDPHDVFLNYSSQVVQNRDDKDKPMANTKHPESYKTTVNIKSSSGSVPFMNFILNQEITNHDVNTGFETAQYINQNFPILVNALWNNEIFFKNFRFLGKIKDHLGTVGTGLVDLMNITYINELKKKDITVQASFAKKLFNDFSLDKLTKALGLDDQLFYDIAPEDEKTLREEL